MKRSEIPHDGLNHLSKAPAVQPEVFGVGGGKRRACGRGRVVGREKDQKRLKKKSIECTKGRGLQTKKKDGKRRGAGENEKRRTRANAKKELEDGSSVRNKRLRSHENISKKAQWKIFKSFTASRSVGGLEQQAKKRVKKLENEILIWKKLWRRKSRWKCSRWRRKS